MGPLAFLGLLDRAGITDRAGLSLPDGLRGAASAISNPQAFLSNQLRSAATNAISEASPQAAAGIAALNVPQAFTDDLKRSVVNGAVADSPDLQQYLPIQDYKTLDLIKTMQAGMNSVGQPAQPAPAFQFPTYDNIDVGGGWNPATPQLQDNIDMGGGWNPTFDYSEFFRNGGKV